MVEVGDQIEIETEKVGQPHRSGVVTGVSGHLLTILWDDGRESTFMPTAGSLRVVPHRAEKAHHQN